MTQVQTLSKARRARTLALSLTALFIGATFYAHNVRAHDTHAVTHPAPIASHAAHH